MQPGEATIKRVKGGLLHFAQVALSVAPKAGATTVELRCSGRGFYSQGYLEEVPAQGYDRWKDGARIGVNFALRVAGAPSCAVVVERIAGFTTDTNPTVVAVAAAHAVWNALGFKPADQIVTSLDNSMLGSFALGLEHLPKL